ncbi:hypothetical protein NT6N_11220 [Oceaniferula spumae]|uniref:Ice-binding protein C-terminal domain-containing protein n=1 Tax=Oceaniferula spumae TaxID=2979115 RepID=A0AAT9FJH6_9BACT
MSVVLTALLAPTLSAALVVNVDFSRDTSISGQNPGGNPAPTLYSGTGPATDAGTSWNDFQVQLSTTGQTVAAGQSFSGINGGNTLIASDGVTDSGFNVALTSGFFRAFNGGTSGGTGDLLGDRVFSNGNNNAIFTLSGLNSTKTYDLYLIQGNYDVTFISGANSVVATGSSSATFESGVNFGLLSGLTPDASGNLSVTIDPTPDNQFGVIAGLQIVEVPEPSAAVLLGLASLAGLTRRRRS